MRISEYRASRMLVTQNRENEMKLTPANSNTDQDIIDAMEELAHDDRSASDIWDDPTEAEMLAIWKRVTKNGLIPSAEFCWGADGPSWANAIEA